MDKELKFDFWVGIALCIFSVCTIFDKTHVFSFGFSSNNPVPVLTLMLVLTVALYVVCRKKFVLYGLAIIAAGLLVSVITGLRFYMSSVSMLEAVLMFGSFGAGIGLILRSLMIK